MTKKKPLELFDTQTTFADLGLAEPLLRAATDMGFEHPTIVQAQLIPLALEGRDVLGQSRTGSGKTAAFGLPVLHRVLEFIKDDEPDQLPYALILVPTRELAIQVAKELHDLAKHTKLKVVPIYGGQRINTQAEKLKRHPQIIVGTPGRVMDMHGRRMLKYDNMRMVVLDEVDRMLDIGFRDDIRKILGAMRGKNQTVFVSATITDEIKRLASKYMHKPADLDVATQGSLTVDQVTQRYFSVEGWDKKRLLIHLLEHEDAVLTLVFCRTKKSVDSVTKYLNDKDITAHQIHGDMYQKQRDRVMDQLRGGKLSVLVASDLAARGLDVDDITHVINYDLPEDPEIYVHRIGRTARAGRDGIAWSFVTPEQGPLLTQIEMLTNVEIPLADMDGFKPGPVPRRVREERQKEAEREQRQREQGSRTSTSLPQEQAADNADMFPGGLVPKQLPKRRMGGKVRTRRR